MRQPASILGIDINSSAVKLVELTDAEPRYQIKNYVIKPLPKGAVIGKTIMDKKTVVAAIKSALRQMATKISLAAMAIPNSAVMTKLIQLDSSLTKSEMENHIFFEADHYFETPVAQIYTDFIVLGRSRVNDKQLDILVVAGQRKEVEVRSEIIRAAGLKLVAMDVESLALARAIKFFYQSNILLVQAEYQSLLLGILNENELLQLHTEEWRQEQNIEFIIQQIKRQLQIISLHQIQPEQIVLMGDRADTFLLTELQKHTQIPVKVIDNLLGNLSPALMLGYGLALWQFA